MSLRALYVSSEIYPLAKTGGLADVGAALPAALASLGVDVRLMLPGYPRALDTVVDIADEFSLGEMAGGNEVRLVSAMMPDNGLPVWLVDCPPLFRRAGGLYQDSDGLDWADNHLRFAVLCQAARYVARGGLSTGWAPQIVHANDWHTGLLPLLISTVPEPRPATLFTVHNMGYLGLVGMDAFSQLALPASIDADSLEFYGQISFLKAGIRHADRLTTVSPTYAREITTAEFGCGLEGLLAERAESLTGILNGADYNVWDPSNDPDLPCTYDLHDMAGKCECKRAVQQELGLRVDADAPLVASLSRIAHQKMADVVFDAVPSLLRAGAQFALVAEGDRGLEDAFRALAAQYPHQVAVRIGYQESLAHRLQAGADMLLHPSRYEPCGLAPMYAMRYGTVPIVRHTGGLGDIVVDARNGTVRRGLATGFKFDRVCANEMSACIERAIGAYRQPLAWRRIQSSAMRQDFGWLRSAERYLALYSSLAAGAQRSIAASGVVVDWRGRYAERLDDGETRSIGAEIRTRQIPQRAKSRRIVDANARSEPDHTACLSDLGAGRSAGRQGAGSLASG